MKVEPIYIYINPGHITKMAAMPTYYILTSFRKGKIYRLCEEFIVSILV